MLKRRGYLAVILSLSFTSFMLVGCKSDEKIINKIVVKDGAVVKEIDGSYVNFNYEDGKYVDMNIEKTILYFDKKSSTYIYNLNGENLVSRNDKEIKLEDKNIKMPMLSKSGEYVSYFKDEGYLELVIIDLDKDEKINLNTSVAISGTLMDWLNEETLVYYGIDDKKNNAIFTYNIKTNEEELLYKLEQGYVEFLKVSDDGVIFLHETIKDKKILKSVDILKNVKEISTDIKEVSDVEVTNNGMFIMGKMVDNNYSIYKIDNGKPKRLVFDFPNILHLEKGLSSDENGNILFIGSTDSFKNENVYIYENESIKYITKDGLKYNFIEIE